MKTTFILSLLLVAAAASGQVSFTTEKVFKSLKQNCCVVPQPVRSQAHDISLSATGDTVSISGSLYIFKNRRSCYISPAGAECHLYYWSGLNGAFVISVEYDTEVYFYQHGELSGLDGGWISMYVFQD